MLMVLQRRDSAPDRTVGCLYLNGVLECYTLEDRVRPLGTPKVPGETAIPPGVYSVALTWSPRFKREMPVLDNVPGFEGIRIHSGNTPEDTEGCILVGEKLIHVPGEVVLGQSRDAYEALLPKIRAAMKAEGCWIDVRNAPPRSAPEVQ